MRKTELNGYDKPNFDNRVKKLLEIENISNLLAKITGMLVISLILILFLGNLVRAQSTDQLFMIPRVNLTPIALNYDNAALNSPVNQTNNSDIYSKGANYRPPQYDAFADGSAGQPVALPVLPISTVESVDFSISNNMPGSSDGSVGTINSTFTFNANTVIQSANGLNLEYRWDFENDGNPDSYFSKIESITHRFSAAGEYQVKLEVLDKDGHVYQGIKKVTVVQNDAPNAYFQVDKISAPINSTIKFDTSLSSDNQYNRYNLEYRFDWDGDGKFDTNFQNKNEWFHQFNKVGKFKVIMEVTDPEGASAQASMTIDILNDTAPQAMMLISRFGQFNYQFDASESSDDHTSLNDLRFRWDFNYAGPDDMVFDTNWSSSPKYTGSYRIGGSKKIRLQVIDQQGFIGESYAEIDVPWTEDFVNVAVGMMK